MKLRTAALLAIPAVVALTPGVAHALPPQAKPTVTCTVVVIDPDAGASVVLTGFIGTHTGLHLVPTQIGTTHNSSVDISALTTATGEIHWQLTPVWTIPPNPYGVTSGDGPTTEGVLTCHEPTTTTVQTTTSSSSSSTSSPTTSSVSPTSSSSPSSSTPTTVAGVVATPSTRIGPATTATAPELPMTGSSHTNAEVFGGAGLLAVGLTLAKGRRR